MTNKDAYRAPIGTKDVIGEESRAWSALIAKFAKIAHLYNYDLALTPTFENFEVFSRIGEDTDIVSKEMYDFHDKGERHIALKPEGTAGIVRAVAQTRPLMPFKAWYFSSIFRYERPQKGRLREHHQFGIECFGVDDPAIDVETIEFANKFLHEVGLRQFSLSVNSLGDEKARASHLGALNEYFNQFKKEFGEEFTKRVEKNPFRMLDTKVPEWIEATEGAPKILDYISKESKDHFEKVCNGLDSLGIKYEIVPKLVRGLDYYTNTTFEFISSSLDAAQSTICGGGRYNKLVAQMGGPETPGIGFGLGVERLLLACESEKVKIKTRELDVVVLDLVQNEKSFHFANNVKSKLRELNLSTESSFGAKSMKASFKFADRMGAKFAVIIGEKELENDVVSLKDMHSGEQRELSVNELLALTKK